MAVIYVIITIVLFLCADWILMHIKARRLVRAAAAAQVSHGEPTPPRIPEGVLFSRSHTWISSLPSGKVRLGLDDFLTDLLEHARVTLIKNEGDRVERGEPLLVLAANGQALAVRAPISGEVISANEALEGGAGLGRSANFDDGWAYTIRPENPEEINGLLAGGDRQVWMSDEMRRLRDFLAWPEEGALQPAAMQDGGTPAPGALLNLGRERWKQFEERFL